MGLYIAKNKALLESEQHLIVLKSRTHITAPMKFTQREVNFKRVIIVGKKSKRSSFINQSFCCTPKHNNIFLSYPTIIYRIGELFVEYTVMIIIKACSDLCTLVNKPSSATPSAVISKISDATVSARFYVNNIQFCHHLTLIMKCVVIVFIFSYYIFRK